MAAFPARAQAPLPVGAEFQVNTYSDGSSGTDASLTSIQGQRFASNGSAQGSEFQVNTYVTGYQLYPSLTVADTGDFVVVWHSEGTVLSGSFGSDTVFESVQGQRYASDGTAQGTEFQVNTFTPGYQMYPSVSAAANGDFVVAWHSPAIVESEIQAQSPPWACCS